ncbi:MAG: SET domain-containing protein [Bacteroidota bacterium]
MSMHIPSLYLAPSDLHHRGVFSAESLAADNVIEICPVIILSEKDRKLIHQTHLHDFYFTWGEEDRGAAIALGYGSLYNHSYTPNARFLVDLEMATISIHSIQAIAAGEEITINYNGDPTDQSPLWFAPEGGQKPENNGSD